MDLIRIVIPAEEVANVKNVADCIKNTARNLHNDGKFLFTGLVAEVGFYIYKDGNADRFFENQRLLRTIGATWDGGYDYFNCDVKNIGMNKDDPSYYINTQHLWVKTHKHKPNCVYVSVLVYFQPDGSAVTYMVGWIKGSDMRDVTIRGEDVKGEKLNVLHQFSKNTVNARDYFKNRIKEIQKQNQSLIDLINTL